MKIDLETIEQLVAERGPDSEFYDKLIQQLVHQTGAEAGVIWRTAHKSFHPIAQHSPSQAASIRISQSEHERMLAQVTATKRSVVVHLGAEQEPDSVQSLVLTPVDETPNVIELLFRSSEPGDREQQLLQQLASVSRVVQTRRDHGPSVSASAPGSVIPLDVFSAYLNALHKSIDRTQTCANIANETRLLLDCDRVSVAIRHRSRFRLEAISGQPSVNRRSNTVSLLQKLTRQVLPAKMQFWFPNENEFPPQVKSLLDEYLSISATRSLVILPIFDRADEIVEDPEAHAPRNNEVIGGVILEHCHSEWDPAELKPALDLVVRHAGNSLRNANCHQQLFLYPVWNWLGKSKVLSAPRILPKAILFFAAILLTTLVLTVWQTPFYVSAKGILVPKNRQLVFPQLAGDIVSVNVAHGDKVKTGETLALLRNRELELRIEDVIGRLGSLTERKSAIERGRNLGNGPRKQETTNQNLNSIQSEIDSLNEQLEQLQIMERELVVVSPLDGEVISWDVSQKLAGRSVTPQNQLMEIADVAGPWQLELDVEDRRIGHLLRGMESANEGQLRVRFTLAAQPNRTFEGRITEVSNTIYMTADNEQVIRIKVDIDEDEIPLKQAKTGVYAKIYTGNKTSLGYLWLHDIPESMQRYVLFYFKN